MHVLSTKTPWTFILITEYTVVGRSLLHSLEKEISYGQGFILRGKTSNATR